MSIRLAALVLASAAIAAPAAPADGKGKEKDQGKDDGRGKIMICHIPPGNPANQHTISVGAPAWNAHRRHGDHRGPCNPAAAPSPAPPDRDENKR
jgi:hypothetical protein